MAEKKQLGIYWDSDHLYCALNHGNSNVEYFKIPVPGEGLGGEEDHLEITTSIQNVLRDHKVGGITANLSLPAKDIIFRSFTLPWMQASELKNVVKFEASKYIPFSLEELAYSYQSVNITEDGMKRLLVIFVAVKKDSLERYLQVLKKTSLQIKIIEPSPISVIRVLKNKKLLPEQSSCALVEKNPHSGKIVIIGQGVPKFVREFHITHPNLTNEKNEQTDSVIFSKIINEIRISLDYFSRQYSNIKTDNIILLDTNDQPELLKLMQDELSMTINACVAGSVIKHEDKDSLCYLKAYGASEIQKDDEYQDYNLSQQKKSGTSQKFAIPEGIKLKKILPTAILCIAAIIGTTTLTKKSSNKNSEAIETISQKLGPFKSATNDMIEKTTNDWNSKATALNQVELFSETSLFLAYLPEIMPEGVWLQSLEIIYNDIYINSDSNKDSHLRMDVSGYAYSSTSSEQFKLVDLFIDRLKQQEVFSEKYKLFNVVTLKVEQLGHVPVTSFKIEMR